MTPRTDRRDVLRVGVGAAIAGFGGAALADFERVNPRLRGVSLSSYSLRDAMQWRWGTKTDRPLTMDGFFEYAAKQGFDAVEPTSYFFARPVTAAAVSGLRRRAHVLGLDISSAAMGNDFSWPPGSERGKENLAYAREWIETLADLGAPALRVFASRRPPEGLDERQLKENVVANLGEVLPLAERCGVMLGIENHDAVRDAAKLLAIVDAVDSDWLGVCFDSGNLIDTPDPYRLLSELAPRAVIAQVKAAIPVNGKPTPADFGRIARVLREGRYAGYLVFEYEEREDPYAAIPRHLADLRAAIAKTS